MSASPDDDAAPAALTAGGGAPSRMRVVAGFWLVSFAFVAVMGLSTAPNPLYPLYAARDGFGSFTVTLIYAAYAIGVVISLFLAGHVSDWYGRRRVLIPAVMLSALSAVLFIVWRSLLGLFVARVVSGIAVGTVVATATAYLADLDGIARPGGSPRRAQLVATTANVGGLGLGALVAGVLAEWVGHPLTIPYLVFLAAIVAGIAGLALTPETKTLDGPPPRYHPQRVSVPAATRGRFVAALVGAVLSFAIFGLFSGLAGTFLADTLHHRSFALAGATIFIVFGSGIAAQLVTGAWPARRTLLAGVATMLLGLAVLVVAAWLPTPSLALFLIGGALSGGGGGAVFRAALSTAVDASPPEIRAEALAAYFLAGYVGISVPVIALGVALRHASTRVTLLGFAIVVGAGIVAATPTMAGPRAPRPGTEQQLPSP